MLVLLPGNQVVKALDVGIEIPGPTVGMAGSFLSPLWLYFALTSELKREVNFVSFGAFVRHSMWQNPHE